MPETALRPAYFWVPERVGSYGDEAVDLARLAGRGLDAEEALAVDAMLSYGPGGRWLTLESAIVEGRQNGKTGGVLLPVVLFDLFLLGADRIVWTAHLFRTARDAFMDFVGLIDGCPELSRRCKRPSFANGEEAIPLHSGARLEFLARSKGGGRGLGGKRIVFDEALFLAADSMGALIPTLSAREDPQINYGSSAGLASSTQLRSLRDRGRRGGDPSLVWIEYGTSGSLVDPPCATGRKCSHAVGSDGCALDDESLWQLANPALGRRISYEYVRAERRALPPEEFARERLGWWDEPDGAAAIPLTAWLARSGAEGRPDPPVAFALSAAWPDAETGSIAVAGRRNGELYVQVVEHRRGTSWMAGRMAELRDQWQPCVVMLDDKDPAAREKPALEVAGVELTPLSMTEAGQAFGLLHAEVMGDAPTLRHYGQPMLNAAVAEAQVRPVGDAQTWARKGSADISPLVAVTHAAYGLATRARPLEPIVIFG